MGAFRARVSIVERCFFSVFGVLLFLFFSPICANGVAVDVALLLLRFGMKRTTDDLQRSTNFICENFIIPIWPNFLGFFFSYVFLIVRLIRLLCVTGMCLR